MENLCWKRKINEKYQRFDSEGVSSPQTTEKILNYYISEEIRANATGNVCNVIKILIFHALFR